VKRWGKSPPRHQKWCRHGKPRVVQDQIGGESWPSSLSAFERTSSLACGANPRKDEPSGRLLDPGREAGARGMIVAALLARARRTESGLQAHPPLSCLFSLYASREWYLLCPLCARYLETLSSLHDVPSPLPQLSDERCIVLFHCVDGISQKFCHIVR
jgi:hypothetical protein